MDEKKLSQKNADTVISLSSLTDTEIQVDRGRTEGGAIQGGLLYSHEFLPFCLLVFILCICVLLH